MDDSERAKLCAAMLAAESYESEMLLYLVTFLIIYCYLEEERRIKRKALRKKRKALRERTFCVGETKRAEIDDMSDELRSTATSARKDGSASSASKTRKRKRSTSDLLVTLYSAIITAINNNMDHMDKLANALS